MFLEEQTIQRKETWDEAGGALTLAFTAINLKETSICIQISAVYENVSSHDGKLFQEKCIYFYRFYLCICCCCCFVCLMLLCKR